MSFGNNAFSNCQIGKCAFSTKIGTGKLGRISTKKQFQTSNRQGSRATSVAIVINKLSHFGTGHYY
jgi:hypothetical protein